jgi:hypothetical protein
LVLSGTAAESAGILTILHGFLRLTVRTMTTVIITPITTTMTAIVHTITTIIMIPVAGLTEVAVDITEADCVQNHKPSLRRHVP